VNEAVMSFVAAPLRSFRRNENPPANVRTGTILNGKCTPLKPGIQLRWVPVSLNADLSIAFCTHIRRKIYSTFRNGLVFFIIYLLVIYLTLLSISQTI
jgi:hypothetical protein